MSTQREAEPQTQRIPARVFLNYASEDRERAVWLQARLLEAGMLEVWLDRTKIEGGERWKREIGEGLLRSTVLLALLTKSSTDPSREMIVYERSEAKRLLKPIIPLRFDAEVKPPEHLAHLHYIDFTVDENAALLQLLNRIGDYTLRYTSQPKLPGEPPSGGTFVGRDTELQELFAMIVGTDARAATGRPAVVIQAMGGQGKTVLAEELVRRIAVRYPGGLLIEKRGESPNPLAQVVFQKWAKKALKALGQQELGRPELALPLLERAGILLKETGGPRERVATWASLGYLLGRHLGQRERGTELLGQAIELMRVNGFERAFGGRTQADLEAQLQEING
jgi:hypothetical protein